MLITLIVLFLVGIIIFVVKIYNTLQAMMQGIRENYSNIQVALKKRLDLANQIIDIAKEYATSEQLTQISVAKKDHKNLAFLQQDFPELKANETYKMLMTQLENLEQALFTKREEYNAEVKKYNSYRNAFPQVLIASKLSFDVVAYFDINDEDFSQNLKIFQRDDSKVLQEVLQSSSKKISDVTQNATQTIKKAITKEEEKS